MKRETKASRAARFYKRMSDLGFTHEETETLRRAQLTLPRWAECECNGEIERDEKTGRPMSFAGYHGQSSRTGYTVPDRETGALRRVKAIVDARNAKANIPGERLIPYHQTDPRGVALYLVKASEIPAGKDISDYYDRGFAVCID